MSDIITLTDIDPSYILYEDLLTDVPAIEAPSVDIAINFTITEMFPNVTIVVVGEHTESNIVVGFADGHAWAYGTIIAVDWS